MTGPSKTAYHIAELRSAEADVVEAAVQKEEAPSGPSCAHVNRASKRRNDPAMSWWV